MYSAECSVLQHYEYKSQTNEAPTDVRMWRCPICDSCEDWTDKILCVLYSLVLPRVSRVVGLPGFYVCLRMNRGDLFTPIVVVPSISAVKCNNQIKRK